MLDSMESEASRSCGGLQPAAGRAAVPLHRLRRQRHRPRGRDAAGRGAGPRRRCRRLLPGAGHALRWSSALAPVGQALRSRLFKFTFFPLILCVSFLCATPALGQYVSGMVINNSTWENDDTKEPGNQRGNATGPGRMHITACPQQQVEEQILLQHLILQLHLIRQPLTLQV